MRTAWIPARIAIYNKKIGAASDSQCMRQYCRGGGKKDQSGRGDEKERRQQAGWKFRPESMTAEDSNQQAQRDENDLD